MEIDNITIECKGTILGEDLKTTFKVNFKTPINIFSEKYKKIEKEIYQVISKCNLK